MESFMKEFKHLEIPLEEIKIATRNFDENNVIGRGGFGRVYKGELSRFEGGITFAFKRLDRKYGQGDPEFWKEVMMLARYKHQNLICLLGFCNQNDERILVYEFASNASLDRHLSRISLTWTQRIKICLDAAKGLSYLHDDKGTHQRVIHRDIKSSNILLDANWNAKVSDMGLAKLGPANQEHTAMFTNIVGTLGYLDPVYLQMGVLTKESDVYSFGVVLIEVMSGRLCFNNSNVKFPSLVPTWKRSYTTKKLDTTIFEGMMGPVNPASLETYSEIAFQCLHEYREDRPLMSHVVEKLGIALQLQKNYHNYEEVLKAVVTPIIYESLEELQKILSKGVLANGGRTWFSLNSNGEHCEIISIQECLAPQRDDKAAYSSDYNSRFLVGYKTGGDSFKTHVRSQFLSPLITYSVNLVFKFHGKIKEHFRKQQYLALPHSLSYNKGIAYSERMSIVHLVDKREDEWLIARLYEFTSKESVLDLEIEFGNHHYCEDLVIEGIEFQPVEKVEDDHQVLEYKEILKYVEPPLRYRSIKELKMLLSIGVLFRYGNTWFYLNDKGENCEMISIMACLIHYVAYSSSSFSRFSSRFTSGKYDKGYIGQKFRARPRFLSPLITYTMNLVFRFVYEEKNYFEKIKAMGLMKYKLEGEKEYSTAHFVEQREDEWLMVELYQFTSDTTTFDVEFIFESFHRHMFIDGIDFKPLEKHDHQVLEDDMEAVSDSDDTYWEQKLPNDYQDIIKCSKDGVEWTTKKELYSILYKGFLMNNGQQWFSIDKNGKKCYNMSARSAVDWQYASWETLPETSTSRFNEAMMIDMSIFQIIFEIDSGTLSFQTRYACYLVYKLREHQSPCNAPVMVRNKDFSSAIWDDYWCIFLVSPQTPVIKPKAGQNSHNPLNRPKLKKGIPQQRSDGWMEVQIYEFQTDDATVDAVKIPTLQLKNGIDDYEVILQGVELRPI